MKLFDKPQYWLVLFLVLHALVLFYCNLLPFWDLPNHLAEATIFKFYNSPNNQFSEYYSLVPWYFPNMFHIWVCNLPIFPSVEIGNKFFFLLYYILLPTSIYLVVKQLKGNTWYALLAFVYLYGYNVSFGFVGYTISIPLLFYIFYFILKDIETPSLLFKIYQAVLLLVIFFMHAQSAMLALLILGFSYLYACRKNLLALWPHILTTVPVVIIMGIWWVARGSTQEAIPEEVSEHFFNKYFIEFYEKLGLPVFDNHVLFEGALGLGVALILFLLVFAPLLAAYTNFKSKGLKYLTLNQNIYITIFLVITFLCYLILPNDLPGQSPISHRFSTILLLAALITGSLYIPKLKKGGRVYILNVLVLHLGLWGHYLVQFNILNQEFNPTLFAGLDNTKRLSGIILNNDYRGRALQTHFQNYYITWNQGIASTMAIDFRFGLVRRKAPFTKLPEHYEWYKYNASELGTVLDTCNYQLVDYILTKGDNPQVNEFVKDYDLVKERKEWKVYSNPTPAVLE
jgi:hypothetical protein